MWILRNLKSRTQGIDTRHSFHHSFSLWYVGCKSTYVSPLRLYWLFYAAFSLFWILCIYILCFHFHGITILSYPSFLHLFPRPTQLLFFTPTFFPPPPHWVAVQGRVAELSRLWDVRSLIFRKWNLDSMSCCASGIRVCVWVSEHMHPYVCLRYISDEDKSATLLLLSSDKKSSRNSSAAEPQLCIHNSDKLELPVIFMIRHCVTIL